MKLHILYVRFDHAVVEISCCEGRGSDRWWAWRPLLLAAFGPLEAGAIAPEGKHPICGLKGR